MREAQVEDPDFDFGSSSLLGASSLSSSEADMCAADDLFFRGQILPLRRLSSANSDGARLPVRTFSGSESMDRRSCSLNSSGGFTSSRSSSSGISSKASRAIPESRIRNPFHAHPSPKPQIRIPTGRAKTPACRSRKSTSVWDIFRLGLMRPPEIEFQDLKLRANNNSRNSSKSSLGSRNSSTNSSSSTSSNNSNYRKTISGENDADCGRRRRKSFDYGLLSGCKCTISEVQNPSKKISTNKKALMEEEEDEDEEEKKKKGGKESMSRHRTFEWLKGISHGAGAIIVD